MVREAPNLANNQEQGNEGEIKLKEFDQSKPEVSGGTSKDYGDPEGMKAADEKRAEALSAGLAASMDTASANSSVDNTTVMEKVEAGMDWPAEMPEVLKKLPEVKEFSVKLVNDVNSKGFSLTRGFKKGTLEFVVKGAWKLAKNPGIYTDYLNEANTSAEAAWNMLLRVGQDKYTTVKSGKAVESGLFGNDSGISGRDRS